MNLALIAIVLALGWAAITGAFSVPNLLFGVAISVVALLLVRDFGDSPAVLRRLRRILALAGLFLRELLLSAVQVALIVVRPNLRAYVRPGFIAFPLTVKSDAEITLLANLITLTPGTLSVDVSEDRKTLFIHVLQISDRNAVVRQIAGGFEAKVLEVFR